MIDEGSLLHMISTVLVVATVIATIIVGSPPSALAIMYVAPIAAVGVAIGLVLGTRR